MNRLIRLPMLFWVVVLALLFAAKLTLAEPYKADAGPYTVQTFELDLEDKARDRVVPIKVYLPENADQPLPVVLVSHGLGGTRNGLSYLGNHWASHGYICVHMQHAGSDDSVWRGIPAKDVLKAMRKAANTPQNAIDRANDVPFVLDELTRMNSAEDDRLSGKVDLNKAAIAGHSFGAWSAMAAGGMTVAPGTRATPGKLGQSFADERIQCMIPLSPPVAAKRQREATYATLSVPALFMTGTLDTSVINNTTAEQRLLPYHLMPGPPDSGAPKYLINFNGADHMTFSGETKRRLRSKVSREDNQAFHSIILQSTTAFLDGYLLDDKDAKTWLNNGGFTALVADRGEVEMEID
jgi:predicted dienelactone hydrolase